MIPNEEILTQALERYSKPNGIVNWKRAFVDNPAWKRTLLAGGQSMQAGVYTPINLIKRARAEAKHMPAPDTSAMGMGGHPPAQGTPTARVTTEEIMKIVDQAALDYRVGKRIQWKQALAEHPEWPAQLHSVTKRNHYLKTLRQRRSSERKQTRATHGNNGAPAGPAAPLLAYCPRCGAHLEAIQVAMSAVQGI